MLKERIQQYVKDENGAIFPEERAYLQKQQLSVEDLPAAENPADRFKDAYLERCNKETEELIAAENFSFLNEPITYLQKHKSEFLYIESKWFELVGADAVSLESDDVFGTYDVMLGLKLQKRFQKTVQAFLNQHLNGSEPKFDLLFSQEDGLWNLNFALNYVPGFKEDMSINGACRLVYRLLFQLAVEVEEKGKQ
ncbi:branched-chain amino acid aminotransferase [Bacillota bacterium Lsc_1132]